MPASSSTGMISPADVPSRNSSAASLTHMCVLIYIHHNPLFFFL
ncbi:unnamed protein product [Linum tenue]|uniref:Uncharacterized protein n=1 Tax=Linum tenue TaxID=586396 RepID=A0AAV0IXN5_9ROSI|nr:unnamed protein product [Linum tenue]